MYFKVYLLRHGKTEGNLHRQYVGVTDQPLCQQGRQEILGFKRASKYPNVDHVFISPLLRCRQTMEMIFENIPFTVVPEFRECNFGNFECRTYEELKDDPQYRRWIDNGGMGAIPGGENIAAFKERCCRGFAATADHIIKNKIEHSALVIHGGTIMAILEAYSEERQDFFAWQISNGQGYQVIIEEEKWAERKKLYQVSKL